MKSAASRQALIKRDGALHASYLAQIEILFKLI